MVRGWGFGWDEVMRGGGMGWDGMGWNKADREEKKRKHSFSVTIYSHLKPALEVTLTSFTIRPHYEITQSHIHIPKRI